MWETVVKQNKKKQAFKLQVWMREKGCRNNSHDSTHETYTEQSRQKPSTEKGK